MKEIKQLALPLDSQSVSETALSLVEQSPLPHIPTSELRALGLTKDASHLVAELGSRFKSESTSHRPVINNPGDLYAVISDQMRSFHTIKYQIVVVNTKHRITHTNILHDTPIVKDVYRYLVSRSAAAFFVVRNSISDAYITQQDEVIVRTLSEASRLIGIDLLDYLIIDEHRFVSAREKGLI